MMDYFSSRLFIVLLYCILQSSCEVNSRLIDQDNNDTNLYSEDFKKGYHKVYKVVDGDTFWVLNERGTEIKVRFIGIDAPEARNAFKKKKHPFGEYSKEYLKDMLVSDPYVRLVFDVDSLDPFGRTLAYVYLSDGRFVNEELVKNGYATISTYPPNVRFEKLFVKSQEYARRNKLGVWGFEME